MRGIGEPRAGDRHRLALSARHPPHQIARAGLRFQFGEQCAGALCHRAVVQQPERPEPSLDLAAEEHVRRGGQVVAQRQVLIDDLDALLRALRADCGNAPARRRAEFRRCVGGKLPAMILTSVDLPAPLSPIRPSTSPGSSADRLRSTREWRRNAWTLSCSSSIGNHGLLRIRPHPDSARPACPAGLS